MRRIGPTHRVRGACLAGALANCVPLPSSPAAPPFDRSSPASRVVPGVLDGDETRQDVWVTGEISNLARPASGHVYFTPKDAEASLRCVMGREMASRQIL